MKKKLFAVIGLLALLQLSMLFLPIPISANDYLYVTDETLLKAQNDPNNWLFYARDYSSWRFSPLTQINLKNVNKLVPQWLFITANEVFGQPIVNNRLMLVTANGTRLYAFDARTGHILWQYSHRLPHDFFSFSANLPPGVMNQSAAFYYDKVYWTTLDGHLIALEVKTGKVIWDLIVADYKDGYTLTVVPLPLRGKIIIGVSGGEYGIRGFIQAFDAKTGNNVWKIYTIPAPGEPANETWAGDSWKYGGGDTWATGSYDPELNTLYWGTGNPGPVFDGEARQGDNLYTNSTLALDPDTGRLKFYFQYTPHDVWDYDGLSEPLVVNIGGKKAWIQANRNGYFYAIDRTNGKLIYARPFAQVNWAILDPTTGRPDILPGRAASRNKRSQPYTCPGPIGGKWGPMAYNHITNMAYIPVIENCAEFFTEAKEYQRGMPYLGGGINLSQDKIWGHVSAVDINTGKIVWQRIVKLPIISGILATAGGLIFTGSTEREGYFFALDANTGSELWGFRLGSSIIGIPITYAIDGKQYIAVPAGGGKWAQGRPWGKAPWLEEVKSQEGSLLAVFSLHE